MDKIIAIISCCVFAFACTTKPDFSKEIKEIDEMYVKVEKSLNVCKNMDTTWVISVTKKANDNIKTLKRVYIPDSINSQEARMVTMYKGYRKVGKKFGNDRLIFIREFEKSLTQLQNLKKDAENGALTAEEVKKYLNDEKLVTTNLLTKFKVFKSSTDILVKNFDSINPLIEDVVEVYSKKFEEKNLKNQK